MRVPNSVLEVVPDEVCLEDAELDCDTNAVAEPDTDVVDVDVGLEDTDVVCV